MDDTTRYQRLLERFRNGDLDRRSFLTLVGAASLAAGVAGGPLKGLQRQALAATPESVRFDGWGGVVSEAFRKHAFDPYTEKTGIKVVDGTFASGDEYLNRVKAGQEGEYNIFHASGVFDYARYANLGYDVVLNEANIPNLQYVMPALMQPFRKVTDGKLSAAPYDYG
ncbi:MAG: twin-arginine translocation signal domain-containing protein, partial [Bacteroidota bacterium]|nr:twin-arginine translocation signal domain-containing protein [Kiloniellaceae bacterium]